MNKQPRHDSDYPPGTGGFSEPPLDQTFVEGTSPMPPDYAGQPVSGLPGAMRIPASQLSSVNPYTRTGAHSAADPAKYASSSDDLPTGNEPIPLGSGTIAGILGSGGMAKVYKIWNEKLEVFRAVKILLPTRQSDLKSRFETEAKITAKLHHPNIVEIYSVGDWRGLPYLEMEYIDGCSLEALIAQMGKLPDAVCSAIAILVARALEYAHNQEFLIYGKTYHGVIHRDLKPANIMISMVGDVRLMDFGIARPTEASLHTVEGNIVGTMQYLSPEQMDGVDIDARTDIYSFGAILYEMLTGTKTFPQDTITNLMKKKILNEYRRFSDFDFAVSHHLARISQKCLQINKNDRYPDMAALLKDLASAHQSLASQPPAEILRAFVDDPQKFAKKRKRGRASLRISPRITVPIAGAAAIAGLVTLFIVTGPQNDPQIKSAPADSTHAEPPRAITAGQQSHSPPDSQGLRRESAPVVADALQDAKEAEYGKPPMATPSQRSRPVVRRPSRPVATSVSGTEAATETAQTKPQSALDGLRLKYGSDDPIIIGRKALASGAADDAVAALATVPAGHPESDVKTMLLLEALLMSRKMGDALLIANSENISDAQFDYLCGLLYKATGKNKQALEYLQTALTKPSKVRNRTEIRNDALYETAVIWSSQHRTNPSENTKIQTLNAWNTVKRTYMSTPNHPRFKRANIELASIQ